MATTTTRIPRIGIIGTGWGANVQVPSFRIVGNYVITAICGLEPHLDKIAASLNIPFACADYKELLSRSDVDMVTVASIPGTHAEIACAALRAGKHVICEKPFTLNVDEALLIESAVIESRLIAATKKLQPPLFIVDHELRALGCVSAAKRVVTDENKFGKLLYASLTYSFAGATGIGDAFTWWHDRKQGGGFLGAMGSHMIDLLSFVTNQKIAQVNAQLLTMVPEKKDTITGAMRAVTSDDTCNIRLQLSNGVWADCHLFGHAIGFGRKELIAYSTKGTLVINLDTLITTFSYRSTDGTTINETWNTELPDLTGYTVPRNAFTIGSVLMFDRIRNSISPADVPQPATATITIGESKTSSATTTGTTGSSPPSGSNGNSAASVSLSPLHDFATVSDGVHVQRVMDACRLSSDTGITVTIPLSTTPVLSHL